MQPRILYSSLVTVGLYIIASTHVWIAESCSTRVTPKPRIPITTARPNITFQTFPCPPVYSDWYCLNGATCFTVKIGESILYNCECASGYIGKRCEFKDLDQTYLQERVMVETASIAGGVSLFVLFIIVFIAISIYIRQQKKDKKPDLYQSDASNLFTRCMKTSQHSTSLHNSVGTEQDTSARESAL